MMEDYSEYKNILKQRLTEKRYYHSVCVAQEACRLAKIYGLDADKAYLAGLLHDITKNSCKDEHFAIFKSNGIVLGDIELSQEKLWHAISGSAYVKYNLKIEDDEIFDAIRYHTTAKADMSLFSKIIYMADFTSADRDYDDVQTLRAILDKSLDNAYNYALSYTVKDLVERKLPIHIDTVNAYNETVLKEECL